MYLSLMWDREGHAPQGWRRHIPVQWADIESAKGQYGFAKVEAWLNALAQPAYLAFQYAVGDRRANTLRDLTPACHRRSLRVTSNGYSAEIPHYGDSGWRKASYAASAALFREYAHDARVAGLFWGPGLDDEVNVAVNWPGVNWFPSLTAQLKADDYYSYIIESTQNALAAADAKPVYLAAAAAPGTPWGQRRKDVTLAALAWGAHYRCNGLREDVDNAVGLGSQAGTGVYEMCRASRLCAFEGGLEGTGQPDMRLYWLLLVALHYNAEHVNLQKTWLPAAQTVGPLLPTAQAWLVFRDAEYPAQTWGATGQGGQPGPFSRNLTLLDWPALPVFRPGSFGYDRWSLTTSAPFDLVTALPAGVYAVDVWRPNGARDRLSLPVANSRLTLPAGAYHRVDVLGAETTQPAAVLTLDERVTRIERILGLA